MGRYSFCAISETIELLADESACRMCDTRRRMFATEDMLVSNSILMQTMINIINAVEKCDVPLNEKSLPYSQVMAIKLFRHVASARQLYDVSTIQQNSAKPIVFVDHGSIMVLARAALETFFVWHYLFGRVDDDESKYRFLTWKLGGLIDRQKHVATVKFAKKIQAVEMADVAEIRKAISVHPNFANRTKNQQIKILAGDWKSGVKTSDLVSQAGLNHTHFKNLYDYLCGYSHTSFGSALQVSEAVTIADQRMLASYCINVMNILMAHFIVKYPLRFPAVQVVIDADQIGKDEVKFWAFTDEEMDQAIADVVRKEI